MASVGEVNETDVLNPQDLEALYSWIDAVPLSRPKKNIARDFADGVSVAEIIQFYLPRAVELHNYVNANSTAQKRINWSMLNRKVFVKLNLKLNEKVVENVIEAKPGAIEQILWDLRKKVLEMSPRKSMSRTNTGNQLKTRSSYVDIGGKKATVAGSTAEFIPLQPMSRPSRLPPRGSATARVSSSFQVSTPRRSPAPVRATEAAKKLALADGSSYSAGLKDELIQFGNNVTLRPEPDSSSGANTGFFPGVLDVNGNPLDSATLPPAHLIYKGHKMVPAMLVDIKSKQVRDLEMIVGTLQKKTTFLDNLIQLKDNRVEDLTRQLHSLRTKFQDFTQTKLSDL